MKKASRLACLALLGLAAAGMWAQAGSVKADSGGAKTSIPDAAPAPEVGSNAPADYVIGADDTLRISVWKEPDLSVTLPVRPDGKISMPLLNDITTAGLTPMELSASLTEKLKKFITDPRVTVVVIAMNSRRIFVTGEVARPGAMALLPNMTVLQALSSAGFTQFANPKKIYMLRNQNGHQVKIPFNYKEVVKGEHPEQNILMKPGDTLVVP